MFSTQMKCAAWHWNARWSRQTGAKLDRRRCEVQVRSHRFKWKNTIVT